MTTTSEAPRKQPGSAREEATVSRASLVLITGLSGAGKTTAMRLMEDLGYNCLDNLPPALVPTVFNLYEQTDAGGPGVAIASDVRSGALFGDFADTLVSLADARVSYVLLYLDCHTDTLIRRFKEVRRTHPLQVDMNTEAAIEEERRRLEPLREAATRIIDTSHLTARDLRNLLSTEFAEDAGAMMTLEFTSFGFKYGLPRDVDFVFDVRFLPNPFYEEELRPLTGEDEPVMEYVMQSKLAREFFGRAAELVGMTLTAFLDVGKTTVSVGIGCTGGRHRSVAIARRLAEHFDAASEHKTRVRHRDAAKPV